MGKQISCGICGNWFEKQHHNKKYCCNECVKIAAQRSREKSDIKMKNKRNEAAPAKKWLSIYDMIELALKYSAESGKSFQYDDIQTMLYTGKLKGGAVK